MKSRLLAALAVRGRVSVGRRFHVGPYSRIWAPRRLVIGDDVYVGKSVTIEVDGAIGDGCLIANNVGIVGRLDHDFRRAGTLVRDAPWVGDDPERLSAPVTIGHDVWIGFGAVVLSGVRVGNGAVVAAGAVVTRHVAENTVVAGNPAEPVGVRFEGDDLERQRELWKQRSTA